MDGTEPPETQRAVCLSRAEGGASAGAPLFSGIGAQASEARAFCANKISSFGLSIEREHAL